MLATAFPKEHRVQQGDVVENKRLSAALDFIQTQQRARTDADFSHGICPKCAAEHFPEIPPSSRP